MEKICIVQLRKRIANPTGPEKGIGPEAPLAGSLRRAGLPAEAGKPFSPGGGSEAQGGAADPQADPRRTVCLTLTPEQTRILRSDPRLVSSLGERPGERYQALLPPDDTLVIELQFESVTPTRLLKIDEVVQMLRIGKGTVNKLIKQGKLKCYRFGRLRRILLDDVLTFLEASREPGGAPARPVAAKAKPSDQAFG